MEKFLYSLLIVQEGREYQKDNLTFGELLSELKYANKNEPLEKIATIKKYKLKEVELEGGDLAKLMTYSFFREGEQNNYGTRRTK